MLTILGLVLLWGVADLTQGSSKAPGSGVVRLDVVTYRKMIPKFDAVLIKFDDPPLPDEPIGPAAFVRVGNAASAYPGLLVAYIHLFEYGPEHVRDLARKFKLEKDSYPCYKLITQGGETVAELNRKNASLDEIKKFIYKEGGYWMDLSVNIEPLDKLITEVVKAQSDSTRQDILEKAQQLANRITGDKQKAIAKMYTVAMKKLIAEGYEIIEKEIIRTEKLIVGKMSEKKRRQLMNRQSVLVIIQRRMQLGEDPSPPTVIL